MEPELVVGFESRNYGAARNTYAPVAGIRYEKLRRVPFELGPSGSLLGSERIYVPIGLQGRRVDLVHLWNRVSLGRGPWGVSFEFDLPILTRQVHPRVAEFQRRRILSDRCRYIIAISDHARNRLRGSVTPTSWDVIEPKLHTVLPNHVQPPRSRPFEPPNGDEPLRLIFVGITFFGKGGEAVLRAFEETCVELDLSLTVISPVAGSDYGGTPPADVDVEAIRRRLRENPRITWHQRCDNQTVLSLIESSHVGLLPTFADTFGYAVLELMALSVPSIVSDVQALPEFTGSDTGWQVAVPIDEEGIWLGRAPDHAIRRELYHSTVADVTEQLVKCFRRLREKPAELVTKSQSSRMRYERQFDPAARSASMRAIYEGALR